MKFQPNLATLRTSLAVAALGIAGITTVLAQGPGGPPPGMGPHRPPMEEALGMHGDHGRWWNEPRAIEKFKLTETQRKSMDDIYQQHRVTLVDLHATLEKAELAMDPLMQGEPDEGKILAQIDLIAQARAELEKGNARMLLGIRKQLTPDQWKQIQVERQARHDGRGPGPGSGDGPGRDDQRKRRVRSGGSASGARSGQPAPPSGGPAGPGHSGGESPDGPGF